MVLCNELCEEQLGVNTESHSIRLIETPELDTLCDYLSEQTKRSYKNSVAMLKLGTREVILDNS